MEINFLKHTLLVLLTLAKIGYIGCIEEPPNLNKLRIKLISFDSYF